jgi:hypothetical protein
MDTNNESIKNDALIITKDVLKRTQNAKAKMCGEKPMSDAPPMMMLAVAVEEGEDGYEELSEFCSDLGLSRTLSVGFAPLLSEKEDMVDALLENAKGLAGNLKTEHLFFVAEGYMKKFGNEDADTELANHSRGDLAKDFSENPFSSVREGIVVTGVDWDASVITVANVTYTYDDFGVPVYDEPQFSQDDINGDYLRLATTGRMASAMVASVAMMNLGWQMRDFAQFMQEKPDNEREGE